MSFAWIEMMNREIGDVGTDDRNMCELELGMDGLAFDEGWFDGVPLWRKRSWGDRISPSWSVPVDRVLIHLRE
jgi:hypothetical protein